MERFSKPKMFILRNLQCIRIHVKSTPSKDASWPENVENVGGDVAQLVAHQTSVPLTQVGFPDAARAFSNTVNFQCRVLLQCPYTPCVQLHALTPVRRLKSL